MIDVTIKTLDSQNHRYSVPDVITVKQFKDRIATSVGIGSDKQRLIYCGRVLQDDKKLSEYNVHEKVIHLVVRAPPVSRESQPSSERRSRRSSSQANPSMSVSGVSSSGVRLQQAKTMLDRSASLLDVLDMTMVRHPPTQPNTTSEPSTSSEQRSSSPDEMECVNQDTQAYASSNDYFKGNSEISLPADDMDTIYNEIDTLQNTEPAMLGGAHMGSPFMGPLNTSLAGGLAQAASAAAAVYALTSMDGATPTTSSPPVNPSSRIRFATRMSVPNSASGRSSSAGAAPRPPGTVTTTATTPNGANRTTDSSNRGRRGSPLGGMRGFTVRITNRGPGSSGNSPEGGRLEHPRCSVMVNVLNQYREVNRRIQPYMERYYQCMQQDTHYDSQEVVALHVNQWLVWRVAEIMHYMSHAMHAISDIIIDLRRNPPRNLRARPIIVAQPAFVHAQLNVIPTSEEGRPSRSTSSTTSTASTTTTTTAAPIGPDLLSSTGSDMGRTIDSLLSEFSSEEGLVLMHVGPRNLAMDPAGTTGIVDTDNPQMLQHLLSGIGSELGLPMGSISVSEPSTNQRTSSNSNPQRSDTPGHSTQADTGSTTNTTNSTQTRVTPRPHVHFANLPTPGVSTTSQFDPFLPCQSHHLRVGVSGRRRHNASMQRSTADRSQNETTQNSTSTAEPTPSTSTSSSTPTAIATFTPPALDPMLAEILSSASQDTTNEDHQVFARLFQDVLSEVFGTLNRQGNEHEPGTSLYDFLQPFYDSGMATDEDRNSILNQLVNTVGRHLSMRDLVLLFFGESARINGLYEPLREVIQSSMLRGSEASHPVLDDAVSEIISDVRPHLLIPLENISVNEGIDYLNTMQNFLRQRLVDIFNLVLSHSDRSNFGSALVSLLRLFVGEFIALSLLCLTDGAEGLERFVQDRVESFMSNASPYLLSWTVNTTLMHLRSMMAQLTTTEDDVKRFIVSQPVELPDSEQQPSREDGSDVTSEDQQAFGDTVEDMEVDEHRDTERMVAASDLVTPIEVEPVSVEVGSQSWHTAVPKDWVPVIANDTDSQMSNIHGTNLSDAYVCGMPLKKRKIANENKPRGSVEDVLRENLYQSLRSAGVTKPVSEAVAVEAGNEAKSRFQSFVRSSLSDKIRNNKDFIPEKFPKAEKMMRKKK